MTPQYLVLAVVALSCLAAAAFAQVRLADFTAGGIRLAVARVILLAVGLGCGYVGAALYGDDVTSGLAFVIGFGVVHLPAAGILYLKGKRGEGRS